MVTRRKRRVRESVDGTSPEVKNRSRREVKPRPPSRAKAVPRKEIPHVESEWVPIDDIDPYANNPRINEEAVPAIARSIEEFGFLVPIVIDRNNVVVAGHTRLEASKSLGLDDVMVVRAEHLSDDQAQAFRVVDNKLAELADWDQEALSEEVSTIMGAGIDLTKFGYSQEEIDCLGDIVSEDCLAVPEGEEEEEEPTRSVSPRAPSRTRCILGSYVFYVDAEHFRRWSNGIMAEADHSESRAIEIIQERLGIDA